MNIVVVGNDISLRECQAKFGEAHNYHRMDIVESTSHVPRQSEVIFDFHPDQTPERVALYCTIQNTTIFINTIFGTLSGLVINQNTNASFVGFCGLPTFFNRTLLEITTANPEKNGLVNQTIAALQTDFKIVKDQVGMVTPRVVCMIINEAFEALQQGVASREDIDLAMRLGTNYPFGPFEWGERIGLENVKRLLNALEKSTGDKRYRSNF
jgi:3-hydroxybutyryl-CoA dehydrogenase